MFTHILFPTDFSDTAGKSLEYLKALRRAGGQQVLVLHIIHQRIIDTFDTLHAAVYFQDGRYQENREETEQRLMEDRRKKMASVVADLENTGFDVHSRIKTGFPVREILKVETNEKVSVIVLGSHGRSNLRGARIGSVSEKIIRRSVSPVLLVKR